MSGTSMDGIDLALLETDGIEIFSHGPASFMPYDDKFKNKIQGQLGKWKPSKEIDKLEKEITYYHIEAIQTFFEKHPLQKNTLDLMGIHGHTLSHQPPTPENPQGKTLQLIDSQMIADHFSCPVVANLRERDIKLGGHGAPLVPIYHAALFQSSPRPLVILNIGGISNITYLSDKETDIIAFDTGPGNALLDQMIQAKLGLPFDQDGQRASNGKVNEPILGTYLADPYFKAPYPKSLDRLYFSTELVKNLSIEDALATLTAFTSKSIVLAIEKLPAPPCKVIVSGGGRKNKTILHHLSHDLPDTPVLSIDRFRKNAGDTLEAEAFAFLAARTFFKYPITFPKTTGVKKPSIGGTLFYPS